MARPIGTKYIETPEKMCEYFLSYKEYVKNTPIKIKDWVGKDAEQVQREKERSLTFIGFQNWLDDKDIITDVTDYFENKDNRYTDYVRICSRIKRNIQDDQIAGGMVGIYNPSITQRLNNLVDRVDATTQGDKIESTPSSIAVRIVKNEEE